MLFTSPFGKGGLRGIYLIKPSFSNSKEGAKGVLHNCFSNFVVGKKISA